MLNGPTKGDVHSLDGDRITLGRGDGNDIQIAVLEVSRQHCVFTRNEADEVTIADLESRHGTLVDGADADGRKLRHGDEIVLGTARLRFLVEELADDETDEDEEETTKWGTGSLVDRNTLTCTVDNAVGRSLASMEAALPGSDQLSTELHALLRLSSGLQETLELAELAEVLLVAAFAMLPVERAGVLLVEKGIDFPGVIAERNGPVRYSKTVIRRVLDDKVALFRPRLDSDAELAVLESVDASGALLAAPMVTGQGESIGVLYLDRSSPGFVPRHLELVTAIVGIATLAFQNALQTRWLRLENRRLREENPNHHDMIGDSPAMKKLLDFVHRVAPTDSTVLVHGESGSGKELVVRALHRASPRSEMPFIAVNCASLSETLLESQLFGHEKGSFTGAVARQIGRMEAAHGGTLFLDEIAEIPLTLQSKLLRALQEREIERLGGTRPIPVDVRLVAATHRDLEEEVKQGRFREDLYYRLKVITCVVPPLRERRDDIPLLVRHFAELHGRKLGRPRVPIAPEARAVLLRHDWPGNVRELANAVERAVVLGDGDVLRREDLPDELGASRAGTEPEGTGFLDSLNAYKKQLILDAFAAAGQDYKAAADQLGVHVNSLHRMIRNLGLKDELTK